MAREEPSRSLQRRIFPSRFARCPTASICLDELEREQLDTAGRCRVQMDPHPQVQRSEYCVCVCVVCGRSWSASRYIFLPLIHSPGTVPCKSHHKLLCQEIRIPLSSNQDSMSNNINTWPLKPPGNLTLHQSLEHRFFLHDEQPLDCRSSLCRITVTPRRNPPNRVHVRDKRFSRMKLP